MIILVYLLLVTICFCEVVQVQVVNRHCDRTPVYTITFPKYPNIDLLGKLNQTLGKLTLKGLKECYGLGIDLKKRYLTPTSPEFIRGINAVYNSKDYKFKSTTIQRSMRSMESIGLGLFTPGTGYKLDIPPHTFPLPFGIQPIPIHTRQKIHEIDLLGYEITKCKPVWDRYDDYYRTKKGLEILEEAKPQIEIIEQETGYTGITMPNLYLVDDYMNVLREHNMYPPQLEHIWDMTHNLSRLSFSILFGREVQGKVGGGNLVKEILGKMNNFIDNNNRRTIGEVDPNPSNDMSSIFHDPDIQRRSVEGSSSNEHNAFKYIGYSSHDSTLGVLLAALRLNEDYEELGKDILYGSAVIFELHKVGGNYFVKILFKRGYNGDFEPYRLISLGGSGCSQLCPLSQYQEICEKDAIPADYCVECANEDTDVCIKEKLEFLEEVFGNDRNTITALSVVAGIFLVLAAIFLVTVIVLCVSNYGWPHQWVMKWVKDLREAREGEVGMVGMGKENRDGHVRLVDEEEELIDEVVGGEDDLELDEIGKEETTTSTGTTSTTLYTSTTTGGSNIATKEEEDEDEDDVEGATTTTTGIGSQVDEEESDGEIRIEIDDDDEEEGEDEVEGDKVEETGES